MSTPSGALLDPEAELQHLVDFPTHVDGRGAQRYEFSGLQLLAPYNGRELPARHIFKPVQCLDLSRSGFSFVLPSPVYCNAYESPCAIMIR